MNKMLAQLRRYRLSILLLVALAGISALFAFPPIAQDPAYHDFVDKRGWLGIPNFGDVAGNILFIFMGLIGLVAAFKKRTSFKTMEYLVWMTFFSGVFLTGFGSGYYHLAPDNHTLVWDRLPMTISFMSLFSLVIMERINNKAGACLFPALLAVGFFSVWYWDYTEALSRGDLRLYAVVQFLPMIEILLILGLFPARHPHTKYLFYTLSFYMLAKVLEHYDPQVFALLDYTISGHTLKHLAAAGGIWWMVKYMEGLFQAGEF